MSIGSSIDDDECLLILHGVVHCDIDACEIFDGIICFVKMVCILTSERLGVGKAHIDAGLSSDRRLDR